uniref:ShKT domain-containing protein n=1 Tax=Gongylonema pulchrum TaxID=637853 RepID=A0A183ECU2_9BILA
LDCRAIAERGQCATADDAFRAILAVECAGTCGLCRHGGCADANYQLCAMFHKLCTQANYQKLMAQKCKRTCNLCAIDVHNPGWIFNKETNAYYKVLDIHMPSAMNESNAVKYEGICVAQGAHLASIHSAIENEFVFGKLFDNVSGNY